MRFLSACSANNEDPVALLQSAAVGHVPLNPDKAKSLSGSEVQFPIPNAEDRPAIRDILDEIQIQDWYESQIFHHRFIEAKNGHSSQ
jgi:hypothetical protein